MALLLRKERAVSRVVSCLLGSPQPNEMVLVSPAMLWCPACPLLLGGPSLPCSASTALSSVQTLCLRERGFMFLSLISSSYSSLPGWWLLCSPSDGTPVSPSAPIQLSLSFDSLCSPLFSEMSSASLISLLPLFQGSLSSPYLSFSTPTTQAVCFPTPFEMSTHQVKLSLPLYLFGTFCALDLVLHGGRTPSSFGWRQAGWRDTGLQRKEWE